MNNRLHLVDCNIYMKGCKDNAFDLAIVDPPYGIGAGDKKFINGSSKTEKPYFRANDWDIKPNSGYFQELFRISNNQIIWGGNYFTDNLSESRGWIVWDKTIHGNSYADCELAWTSFNMPIRYFRENIVQTNIEGRIHPTQKSITLYKWLLQNYAKPNDKILDTHSGSGSLRIACHDLGFDIESCELDPDYYRDNEARYQNHIKQADLFEPEEIQKIIYEGELFNE